MDGGGGSDCRERGKSRDKLRCFAVAAPRGIGRNDQRGEGGWSLPLGDDLGQNIRTVSEPPGGIGSAHRRGQHRRRNGSKAIRAEGDGGGERAQIAKFERAKHNNDQ